MKSLIVALALITPALSQAETATYKGEFDKQTITVRFEVKLPSAVQVTPGGEYQDPEMGTLYQPTTYQSEVGTITVSYRGETSTQANFLVGDDTASGVNFESFASFEPSHDTSGQLTEGLHLDSLMESSQMGITLNQARTQITGIGFPRTFTTHAIYYHHDDAVAGDDVRFVKQ